MDYVFAKIKALRKKAYFKVASDHTLYDPIKVDLAHCIEYNPDHNLDEDSWFKIEEFSKKEYCIDLLKGNFDSKDYDDLTRQQFLKIAYLFAIQGDDIYFQKVLPSLFVKRKLIKFGETATIDEDHNRLSVKELPDAVYFKDRDALIFKNLVPISSIFKGIDLLYREATQAEVTSFLGESFVNLSANFKPEQVSKPNRKRIALAMKSLSQMSGKDKKEMLKYIHGYNKKQLTLANGQFEISSDNELKMLLYGIEQRFYTTPFGKEKRLANSVVKLGS